jgi:hypothetical protein
MVVGNELQNLVACDVTARAIRNLACLYFTGETCLNRSLRSLRTFAPVLPRLLAVFRLNIVSNPSRGLRALAVAVLYCVCLITALHVDAGEAEERRVRISLEIFPRIVAVDLDLRSKVSTIDTVRLFVVFERDTEAAHHVSEQMKNAFSNIGGLAVEFVVQNAQQAVTSGMEQAAAVFLSDQLSDDAFAAMMKAAVERHVLVFSPFAGDVERGATVGIAISSRIKPYFNVSTLVQSHININEKLLSISQRYE